LEEEIGYMIVYDLPNEDRVVISESNKLMNMVKRARINSCRKLSKYGLQCTESVLLVPKQLIEDAKKAIDEIRKNYNELEEAIAGEFNLEVELKPEIYIIPLFGEQTEVLKTIAVKRLIDKLEKLIKRLIKLSIEVADKEEKERRKIRKNVKRVLRELKHTEDIVETLEIDNINLKEKLKFAEDVIKEVLSELETGG